MNRPTTEPLQLCAHPGCKNRAALVLTVDELVAVPPYGAVQVTIPACRDHAVEVVAYQVQRSASRLNAVSHCRECTGVPALEGHLGPHVQGGVTTLQ
jgi:hypothetical protein